MKNNVPLITSNVFSSILLSLPQCMGACNIFAGLSRVTLLLNGKGLSCITVLEQPKLAIKVVFN